MDLKIDANGMQAIVAKAILDGLTDEQRAGIITQAVAGLMTEQANPHNFHDKTTVLEAAFNRAAREAAMDLARAKFKEPAQVKAVEAVIASAMEKVFSANGKESLAAIIAEAMVQGLREHAALR